MSWSMAEVCRGSGVTSRTLRHYHHIGLLEPESVGSGGQRRYGDRELRRLQRILVMRELGLGLADIRRALDSERDEVAAPRRHLNDLEAERTGHGIALEDLQGIRGRVRLAKQQRAALHSWGFAQLRDFITYKARRAEVPVLVVDPAYTSQSCSECDHTDRRNRPSRSRFVCRGCGAVLHADVNASRNLAHRGESAWNAGRQSIASAPSR